MRVMNFNSGPATLPLPALERAQAELLDFAGTGMSVMEHSHRGKDYEGVHHEAATLLRELVGIGDDWHVLFLQGGATMQFAQVPFNLLPEGGVADYVVNGIWGEKAASEADATARLRGGRVAVIANTARDKTYRRVARQDELVRTPSAAYVHFTSNETIHGVQYAPAEGQRFPDFGPAPWVCDMSSDFMWRPTDLSPFGLVYAGAQKNIGPSGLCVVLAKKELVARGRTDLPKILRYDVAADNDSMFNTPPTFSVYLVRNVLAWTKAEGGLAEMERRNREKARLLYGALDASPHLYACPVEPESRSTMNAVFRLPNAELEAAFVREAREAGMVGVKGHRIVGGMRISLYNAVPVAWIEALVSFMRDFARRHG
jgi:phosphoserine aminotransferase